MRTTGTFYEYSKSIYLTHHTRLGLSGLTQQKMEVKRLGLGQTTPMVGRGLSKKAHLSLATLKTLHYKNEQSMAF